MEFKKISTKDSVKVMMERQKLRQRIDPFKYAKKLGIDLIIQNEEILADYKKIVQEKIQECNETINRLKPRDRWRVTLMQQREEELKERTL